jgi:transcriptional regulator with XRE-family HTH domain
MPASTQTASDLGRRVIEQRRRAGLSRAETAQRAGMSPSYLKYLETSSAPDPGPGALARLAAALGTTVSTLTGSGMNLPPGRRRAARQPLLQELSPAECQAYLTPGGVGRFLFTTVRGPVAIPVNYRMLGQDVVFRTGRTAGAAAGAQLTQVSFDVDHIDEALGEGWSVLVSGDAHLVIDPDELEQVTALGITPWAGGQRDTYVRLTPREITGRRIRAIE